MDPKKQTVLKKKMFLECLDKEVLEAKKTGSGFILHFEGNLWAGESLIPGDPRPQNKNGQLFQEFLTRNSELTNSKFIASMYRPNNKKEAKRWRC